MKTEIKQKFTKLYDFVLQFRDVRAIGLLLFLVTAILISWSGVKIIDTNYKLQKDISRLEQQNEVKKLANDNMKLENQYYQTDQYLELSARQNFGMAAPGETVLNIPQSVALAHTIDLADPEQQEIQKTESKQPTYQRNFQAWIDFLLHRNN